MILAKQLGSTLQLTLATFDKKKRPIVFFSEHLPSKKKLTDIAPARKPSQKETHLPRCYYVSFHEGINHQCFFHRSSRHTHTHTHTSVEWISHLCGVDEFRNCHGHIFGRTSHGGRKPMDFSATKIPAESGQQHV